MKQPKIALAQLVIQACKAKDIRHIVISPGSRNAPLTIGFTYDRFFKTYSIVDERCAAFFAIGMAQQLQYPVAVVCTSGSALLNYYPAVAEAFYSNIPLIIISADRPSHKIDIGDGQTIRQANVFASHCTYNANLSEYEKQEKSNVYEINNALNTAIIKQTPVHINVPFEEPLYLTTEKIVPFDNREAKKITYPLDENQIKEFIKNWNNSSKKIILVGVLPPKSVKNEMIEKIANDPSVLVLTETTSNIKHSNFISHIDQLLHYIEKDENLKKELQPNLLLTFGGLIVSKKIKQFLRSFQPTYHYHVDLHKGYDSYFCLTYHFQTSIHSFWQRITNEVKKSSSEYQYFFLNIKQKIQQLHIEYLASAPYSDIKVYEKIFAHLPNELHIQISNSSPIRYSQLFEMKRNWQIFCNRGTSGIDGSTSTAIGAAIIQTIPTLLITGDLSFFYDSNALWNKYVPNNFRVIIINNNGGGIFRILPNDDKDNPNFETYFETVHRLTAEQLACMYQWEYQRANDIKELQNQLKDFFSLSKKPKILEIQTPREKNDKILLKYFQYLKK